MIRVPVLWRRLDAPGLEACWIRMGVRGVVLTGASAFLEDGRHAHLRYWLRTDPLLHTERAVVAGYVGRRSILVDVRRSAAGVWTLNGEVQDDVHDCVDLDLAFTPATNLLPLRRLKLARGEAAAAPAAYLQLHAQQLTMLDQSYRRASRSRYLYQAPAFAYTATLRVSRDGIVLRYPALFEGSVLTSRMVSHSRTRVQTRLARRFQRFVAAKWTMIPCGQRLFAVPVVDAVLLPPDVAKPR